MPTFLDDRQGTDRAALFLSCLTPYAAIGTRHSIARSHKIILILLEISPLSYDLFA